MSRTQADVFYPDNWVALPNSRVATGQGGFIKACFHFSDQGFNETKCFVIFLNTALVCYILCYIYESSRALTIQTNVEICKDYKLHTS